MGGEEKTTLERILSAAKAEFLEKGFRSASLRNIAGNAGVTTGALYGYFASKEELFDALVGEKYEVFMGMYRGTQEAFTRLSPEEQVENMGKLSGECLERMLEYAYADRDVFRLLLCCAEGTRYENMVHDMVAEEVSATHSFAHAIEGLGYDKYELDPTLEHILVSGMFSAFFEMIIHNVPYERASEYLKKLRAFYTAGWREIMGF